jgi:hypothetical protein
LSGGHGLHAGSLEPSRVRRAGRGVWWYACVSVYLRRDFAGGASVVVPGLGRGHGQIRAAPCRPPSFSVADDSLLVVLAAPGPGVRAGAARCTSVDERSCSSAVVGVVGCVCACVCVAVLWRGSVWARRPTAGVRAAAGPVSSLAAPCRASAGRWQKRAPRGPGPRLAASSRRSVIAARLAARSRRRSARSAARGRAFRRLAAARAASEGGFPAYLAATTSSHVVGNPPACARSRNRRRGSRRSELTFVAPTELEDV